MRRRRWIFPLTTRKCAAATRLCLGLWLGLCFWPGLAALAAPATAATTSGTGWCTQGRAFDLTLMTFNLRSAAKSDAINSWENRKDLAAWVVESVAPDVFGVQEAFPEQLADLKERLGGYEWFGVDRNGRRSVGHNAIFYRTESVELLDFGYFWLSDTPSVPGSATWGHSIARMVTWGHFRHRASSGEFLVYNTHFHHLKESSRDDEIRERSARLIVERVTGEGAASTKLPVVLMGDFNTDGGAPRWGGSKAHDILVRDGSFEDAWFSAEERDGPYGTFHSFTGVTGDRRSDWILARGDVRFLWVRHITDHDGRVYPSDHLPVAAGSRMCAS